MDMWSYFQFDRLFISWRVIRLTLKRTFTTAHSSSDTRDNFFFKIGSIDLQEYGYGECGLPPKKPFCYLADINNCKQFVTQLSDKLCGGKEYVSQLMIQEFRQELLKGIPQNYLAHLRETKLSLKQIWHVLYWAYKIKIPQFKAAISALQFAIFDFLSKALKISLTRFIFGDLEQSHQAYSFYTLSYEQNKESMIQNAMEFLTFTPYIKVKYVDHINSLLDLLTQLQERSKGNIQGYIIDANASWRAQSFKFFNDQICLQKYEKLKNKIMYIQQPFPIQMSTEEYNQWASLKQKSKLKIMIDESFSSYEQVQLSLKLGHAVNIKSQKAGGPIGCIRAALEARKYKMEVMFGSMVSTHLGCNQTYSLYPFTKWLDVDGSLLVQSPNLKGGFIWGSGQGLKQPHSQYFGLEVDTSCLNS